MIAGHDRDEVTALLVPDLTACRRLCGDLPASDQELFRLPPLRRLCQERLDALARIAAGSSTRVARALLLDEPLSIDAHELTDKGTINQQAVLARRAQLVEELYALPYSPRVLVAAPP